VQRYRRRISGPLLDRIDLVVEIAPPSIEELAPRSDALAPANGLIGNPRWSEDQLRGRVEHARSRARGRDQPGPNSTLDAKVLDRVAPLDEPSRVMLSAAARKRGLSARALQSLRRVARTCADLEDEASVTSAHIAQALALRAAVL
jgi:magnesium chelatase family protein